MKKLLNYFLQGLLLVVPITVTIWILIRAILWIDGLLPFQVPIHLPGTTEIDLPGLGLLTIFLVIALLGYFSSRYLRNPLFSYFETLIEKAPLTKLIYSSVKDLIQAFVGEKRRFNHPVLVRLEKDSDINRIGFVTQEDLTDLGISQDKVAVYLPFSYGFNGELIILPKENVKPIDASGTDMMKFIISGGVSSVDHK
ncbi:MAG: hypothetical protein RL213_1283 [Bacteroidota bacterium]|jgi:uncharacterized membrane protein